MKIAAIHQPQYLPYLGFFHKLTHCDVLVAMDTVQFQRRGVQHRNRIKTKDGWQWLTVPVRRPLSPRVNDHRSEQPTSDVMIDNTDSWQRRHMNALQVNYSRAPHYRLYAPKIEALLGRPWRKLCDLDMSTTRWVMDALAIRTPIVYMSELGVDGGGSQLLVNVCKAVGADHYLSGPGGKQYMDLELFGAASIRVLWQEFTNPRYPQLFPEAGFIPDLSVVDVLFCCGPEAKTFVDGG